jgi:2-phospho-L-lactate/phosphoenolpyruvate guanylyltransferase
MNTFAILPMKPFEHAKQRLSAAIGSGQRRALAEAMFCDVLVAARRTSGLEATIVVTADRTASRIASGYGASVIADTGSSHSQAAILGITRAVTLGAERVLLIPGDCPLLDPVQLDALLAHRAPDRSALIIPDRHGSGTNALLLAPPDSLSPAFGEGSRQRHVDLASAAGTTPEVIEVASLGLDIDTPDDFALLRETLVSTRGGAPHTRGMLNQMDRSEAR